MTEFEKQDQVEYKDVPQNEALEPQDNGAWNQNPEPWNNGQFQNTPQNDGHWNQNQWNNGPYPNEPQGNGQWNQNPGPWNNGQFSNGPQNNGQFQNGPQNNGQFQNGPQNNGQFQNGPQNNGQWNPNQGPQNQRPYQNPYNPYERNPKKNGFATSAFLTGIFAVLNLCCFTFTSAIILGVGAICIAIISKRDEPFTKKAIIAMVLGGIAILGGIAEFFYSLWLSDLMRDPANIEMFNRLFEQFENEMGVPLESMLP